MATRRGHVVDLWWADLRSADARLFGLLDDRETERLDRMERAADRGRFVLGAALLRLAVGAATGEEPRSVAVGRTCADCGGDHGAPRVDGVRVSVTHAGPLVLVATAADAVGVDVEAADRGDDVARWVLAEARFKTGCPPTQVSAGMVGTPRPGYLAALAVAGHVDPEVITHPIGETAAALERLATGAGP
ncbi:4'-phosphopantetheinyl transferase family protein [Janibacter alittae]|uniref:4-phosphopantetheinyl transferase n=1 Tax=Janibacter alittae TaxID=3115209 RepID=A0ABZ2MJC0_9MICO